LRERRQLTRPGVRVCTGEQEQIAVRLCRVAQRLQAGVLQPARHLARHKRGKPGKRRARPQQSRVCPRHNQGRKREDQSKADAPAILAADVVDLRFDGIGAACADESGKWVTRQGDERIHLRCVTDIGRKELVQRPRRTPPEQGRDPVGNRDEEHDDAPERQPRKVGKREQEPEEHGEARAAQVVLGRDRERVVSLRELAQDDVWIVVGISARQHEEICPQLCAEADPPGDHVAQAARHPRNGQAGEPAQERAGMGNAEVEAKRPVASAPADRRRAEQGRCEQKGRYHEDKPKRDGDAALALGRADLDVDRVTGPAVERRIRVGRQEKVGVDLGGVFDIQGEESVQCRWRASRDKSGYPVDDRRKERADAPYHEPDPVRNHKQQPEEDRQTLASQVVVDHQTHGVAVNGRGGGVGAVGHLVPGSYIDTSRPTP